MLHKSQLSDSITAFLRSPVWAILRYRLSQYEKNCDTQMHALVRKNNPHCANREDAKIEAIGEIIRITEGLNKDLEKLDVDDALNVIEKNKGA